MRGLAVVFLVLLGAGGLALCGCSAPCAAPRRGSDLPPVHIRLDSQVSLAKPGQGQGKEQEVRDFDRFLAGLPEKVAPYFDIMLGASLLCWSHYLAKDRWPRDRAELEAYARSERIPLDLKEFRKVELTQAASGKELTVAFSVEPEAPEIQRIDATVTLPVPTLAALVQIEERLQARQ